MKPRQKIQYNWLASMIFNALQAPIMQTVLGKVFLKRNPNNVHLHIQNSGVRFRNFSQQYLITKTER